ncbi:MAG: hypothetical protein Fur0037_05260 [Planctomycetota bacterium]
MPFPPQSVWILLVALASCYRIEHRTTIAGTAAVELAGEWSGTWADSARSGRLAILVRFFDGQPLLRLETDHPAAAGQSFSYAFAGSHLELAGQDLWLSGDLDQGSRTMRGAIGGVSTGTWEASWLAPLPPIVDLSGVWEGSFSDSSRRTSGSFSIALEQRVADGAISVSGSLRAFGLSLPIADGYVEWGRDSFDIRIWSDPYSVPVIQLSGVGDPMGRSIDQGDYIVMPHHGLPVALGSWRADWISP